MLIVIIMVIAPLIHFGKSQAGVKELILLFRP